jgi:hypothetical protein
VKGLYRPMQECKQCGKVLPPPKQKTPREREYCNDLCRKRANREKHAWKHNLNTLKRMRADMYEQEYHRETWMDEIEEKNGIIEEKKQRNTRFII